MNFTRLIRGVSRRLPGNDAVVTDDKTTSFSEFWRSIASAGQFYLDSGVTPGDRVLLILPNSHDFLHFHFGALKIGAISVPVRYDYTGWEVRRMVANCKPRLVLSTAEWFERNHNHLRLSPRTSTFSIEAVRPRMRPGGDTVVPLGNRATASINYSYSGDGYAKGAMLTHANHLYAAIGYARHQGFQPDDRLLIILPMCHVYALSGCVNAGLIRGAALVLSNHHTPRGICRTVEHHRITILSSVPAIYECFAAYSRRDRYNLSSLRRLVTGGAYMPAACQRDYQAALGVEMVQGYGLTECLPVICNPPGAGNRPGTLGIPGRRDIEIRIMGASGCPLPRGTIGEIQIRSTTTMAGYYRLPEDTRKLFEGEWLRTGDLGALDAEGYLHFHGMMKQIVNANGNKIDLIEVRDAILENPAVANVEVRAESAMRTNSFVEEIQICARVMLKRGWTITESEIRAFCTERLAGYKLPQAFAVVNSEGLMNRTIMPEETLP